MTDQAEILDSIVTERTVDIVTTGRKSGQARTTEIWISPLFGRMFICGTPNASIPGVDHQPRDWLANLLANPDFTLRLKRGVLADLTARATPITDPVERGRILRAESSAYYLEHAPSYEVALQYCPMVEVHFTGDAAWLTAALAARA